MSEVRSRTRPVQWWDVRRPNALPQITRSARNRCFAASCRFALFFASMLMRLACGYSAGKRPPAGRSRKTRCRRPGGTPTPRWLRQCRLGSTLPSGIPAAPTSLCRSAALCCPLRVSWCDRPLNRLRRFGSQRCSFPRASGRSLARYHGHCYALRRASRGRAPKRFYAARAASSRWSKRLRGLRACAAHDRPRKSLQGQLIFAALFHAGLQPDLHCGY
jgi:hypothetical protein